MTTNSNDKLMILRCIAPNDHVGPRARSGNSYTQENEDLIRVDHAYRIFGMAYYGGDLLVLVRDGTRKPNWYPVQLFDAVDESIPADWKFGLRDGGAHGLQALWGYPTLVRDVDHYVNLIEREPEALEIFQAEAGPYREPELFDHACPGDTTP